MSEKEHEIKPLVNRVANSGIEVFNLEDHYPVQPIVEIDLKQFLFKELILREKEFRTALKEIDWNNYQDKIVLVYQSNDAIIPIWAYMLINNYLTGKASYIYNGSQEEYLIHYYTNLIAKLDSEKYDEKRVVIKGCSNKPVPAAAYAALTSKLKPYAQSIMFGEPCSTVPIFKRPRKLNK